MKITLKHLKKIKGYNEKYMTNYEDIDISKRLRQKGYDLIYEPNAVASHLKKDNIKTILKTTRRWSFFSYPQPNNLINLFLRLLIYNPYIFLRYLIKELFDFKLNLIGFNLLQFLYNQIYDLNYYLRNI